MNRQFAAAASSSTTSLLPTDVKRAPPSISSQASSSRRPSVSRGSNRSSIGHLQTSLSEKYSLSPSPATWGAPLLMSTPEPDDYLHNPDPRRDRKNDFGGTIFTTRGFMNVGCLVFLVVGMIMLFAGYPIISHFTTPKLTPQGGFNIGGINATGQIPDLPGNFGLIDKDTPSEAYTRKSHKGEELILVFSDEFNQDGRTFWPGDDPYWEAADLHYWGTNDLEWYDPHQVTTSNGSLQLRMDDVPDPTLNHNMQYRSGMIQSWNKFCFTGGMIEVSVRLPGTSTISGLWPGVWTMGNLGRAGHGASVEGLWPYSYDSCDVGTLPNQTFPGTSTPVAATENGDPTKGGALSWLSGQRLSACTCPGESHPGPVKPDGSYVGRASPEIDVLEAIVEGSVGQVSISSQWAPFSAAYRPLNLPDSMIVHDTENTILNPYRGNYIQQTTSALANTNQSCYELSGGCFTMYGFEYKPGFDNAYITWYNNGKPAWTVLSSAVDADPETQISRRLVPLEPMYIITNLGISRNFGKVDQENLVFPATMSVDYIRVYQPKDQVNVGCDPKEFPTAKYIDTYKEVYTNPNLTTWAQYGEPWPKNNMNGGCK